MKNHQWDENYQWDLNHSIKWKFITDMKAHTFDESSSMTGKSISEIRVPDIWRFIDAMKSLH